MNVRLIWVVALLIGVIAGCGPGSETQVPTDTDVPTMGPTAKPTSMPALDLCAEPKPETMLKYRLEALEGVTEVHVVSILVNDDGSSLVDIEVKVAPGQVTMDMADQLLQETKAVLMRVTQAFSALLYTDDEASRFEWDNDGSTWDITPVSAPSEMEATE